MRPLAATMAYPRSGLPALLSCLAATFMCGVAPPQAKAGSPSLTGVRIGGDARHARLVLEFDRPLVGAPALAPEPASREELLFASAVGDLEREGGGLGPIRHWWLATADADQTRLIVGVQRGASIVRRFSLAPAHEGGPWRYVVDVAAGSPPIRASARPSIAATQAKIETSAAPSATTGRRRDRPEVAQAPAERVEVVVIDPGHGGFDPGARGVGVAEKDVNLAEALALRERLRGQGRYKVVLTRDTDVFVPLDERVRIARRVGADLFISLHSDSAGTDPSRHGASVYTLSDHGVSRVNEVIGPGGWMGERSEPGVGPILLDLTQRDTMNRSAVFAGLLIDRIRRDFDLLPRTHRDAGYFVLLAPDVPAVLLEMGFITSPLDQARLTDPTARIRLADAIGEAIDAYFLDQTAAAGHGRKAGLVRASLPWPESSSTPPG